jgi:hypothetical protein
MQLLRSYLFLFVILTIASCSYEGSVELIPLEKFFAAPLKTSFLLSPDGKFISYLKNARLNMTDKQREYLQKFYERHPDYLRNYYIKKSRAPLRF